MSAQPSTQRKPRLLNDAKLLAILSAGLLLRTASASTPLGRMAQDRPELSTPLTAWKNLREGVFLYRRGHDPYDGGAFYQSPLLLFLFSPAASLLDSPLVPLAFAALDIVIALLLVDIASSRQNHFPPGKRKADDTEAVPLQPWQVAAIYLFSPFTVLPNLARSLTIFSNLAILVSLASALRGSALLAMVALSAATQLGLYPALLVPLCALTLSHRREERYLACLVRCLVTFLLTLTASLFLSHLAISRTTTPLPSTPLNPPSSFPAFISSVYLTILSVPDLTPNIGLHWYFATEMFDHFRSFFTAVFQMHVAVYVAPLAIKFRDQPLFAMWVMCGIIATFKSYPDVSDVTLYISLLSLFPEIIPHMRYPLFTASLFLYSSLLLPTFHHLWLVSGSGNANFFYASTLVWSLANGSLLVDGLWAGLRREYEVQLRAARGRDLVEGEEVIVHG